jgi:hypothetical protein
MSNEVFKAVGRVNQLSIMTIDAYGVAVKNGFEGTVEEWLASLHGKDATDDQITAAVEAYMAEHPIETPDSGGNADQSGGGLSATASALLITILRNGVYSTDQSANITALEAALASGGSDEPDTPEPPASDVEQNGTILSIVSGVTVSQTGSVLAIA